MLSVLGTKETTVNRPSSALITVADLYTPLPGVRYPRYLQGTLTTSQLNSEKQQESREFQFSLGTY